MSDTVKIIYNLYSMVDVICSHSVGKLLISKGFLLEKSLSKSQVKKFGMYYPIHEEHGVYTYLPMKEIRIDEIHIVSRVSIHTLKSYRELYKEHSDTE